MRSGKLLAAVIAAAGCVANAAPAPKAPPPDAGIPFRAVPPGVYVAKVKSVLVGLPPEPAEVQAVEGDPRKLAPLVERWMARPEYARKLRRFFELAFQQTQLNANDFADQVFAVIGRNDATTARMIANVEESFARTMVALTAQERPFTEAMTTRRVMMTTALKELYALLDDVEVDNQGIFTDHFRAKHRGIPIVVRAAGGPIPIEQSVDPKSPNYMHWYDPDILTEEKFAECKQDPIALPPTALGVHFLLMGSIEGRHLRNKHFCPGYVGTPKGVQFAPSDFQDWTMVTIRPAAAGEDSTVFYDLPALRKTRELVLRQPRLGFFSTPAFFANWQTNTSNQMRVTANQALIVGLGAAVDGIDNDFPPGNPGLDKIHSARGDCASCHMILDPTRSIFAATWSWNYHTQTERAWSGQPGMFAFRGVVKPVKTIDDFAEILVHHPALPGAWVQKLCYYVNSAPCTEDDPEFKRLVDLFQSSHFSFHALVKALVTSPLVTNATGTATARAGGEVVAVERRDHFCAALGARLGFADACGLSPGSSGGLGAIPKIASGLPSDAYGRGAVVPILPNDPSLFFVAGIENICKDLASAVIDAPAGSQPPAVKRWSSARPDAAIGDFVGTVMALADARAARAKAALQRHFATALQRPGITATQALRSTFVVACMSPSAISVGL